MDCVSAADGLKKLLVVHSVAETQVSVLDFYRLCLRRRRVVKNDEHINSITQQTMVSSLDGDRSRDLHLSLRLSVCEGVKVMYQKYQNKKWSQVQATAREIIQTLEGDLVTEQTISPVTSPGGSTSVDKAAGKWTTAFCEYNRGSSV